MTRNRHLTYPVMLGLTLMFSSCDLVNPERPMPQPDITVYGNLMSCTASQEDPGAYIVKIQVAKPQALNDAKTAEGKPVSQQPQGPIAAITVDEDTVVVREGTVASVEDFSPGTELVIQPVPGTTMMTGTSLLTATAQYLMDFTTYRGWQLPRLAAVKGHPVEERVEDPALINTAGVEHSPVPAKDGLVLYFCARLRRTVDENDPWCGAQRDGLAPSLERTYRTTMGADGWAMPELVRFPGSEDASSVCLSWINKDETRCLVTITQPEMDPWVGEATRPHSSAAWSKVERLSQLGTGSAASATYLTGSKSKIVFVAPSAGMGTSDLMLYDPSQYDVPVALDPRINTTGEEWSPRTGPDNELLFCRGDRQLILQQGQVRPVRLPGPHRALISNANTTADGKWIFFCLPKFTPVDMDRDIYVAPLDQELELGDAVPVDMWRLPASD